MRALKRKRCKHCKKLFLADPRNIQRQNYCCQPQCRIASKRDSQRRWLSKPENRDYFRGPEHVIRVQQWRKTHPGYWRKAPIALQDPLIGQPAVNIYDTAKLANTALQDLLNPQPAVLIGLIANFTGLALQDDIAKTVRNLQQLGQDIINPKGGRHDIKTAHFKTPHPQSAPAVQLDRSAPGP